MTTVTYEEFTRRCITKEDCKIHIECLPEGAPIAGNVILSGDSAIDKQAEQEVLDALEKT